MASEPAFVEHLTCSGNHHDVAIACFAATGHSDRVTCLAISRDGTKLASGQITHMGYLAEIILWV